MIFRFRGSSPQRPWREISAGGVQFEVTISLATLAPSACIGNFLNCLEEVASAGVARNNIENFGVNLRSRLGLSSDSSRG